MNDSTTQEAAKVHEATRLLFLSLYDQMQPVDRRKVESNGIRLIAEIPLDVRSAAVAFVAQHEDGRRESLGVVPVPMPDHDSACECVSCK